MPQTRTPLASSAGIELVVHDAAVAHDDHRRVRAGLRGPRAAAGRALVAGRAELVLRERPVAVEVELVDPAVAPDLLVGVGHAIVGEPLGRRERAARRASRARRAPAPRRR